MGRYSVGALTTAGSTTLPVLSLYAAAAVGGAIRECSLTNTTTTAVALKLTRVTTTGVQGTALTEDKDNSDAATSSCQGFNTHTGAPTLGNDMGSRAALGAAIGAGVIWTYGDTGLRIPVGTANGIGAIVENGTGQAVQAYFRWDE